MKARFSEEYTAKKLIVVCNEQYPRRVNQMMVLPWKIFLEQLWNLEIT
jgi:uncharacterized protein